MGESPKAKRFPRRVISSVKRNRKTNENGHLEKQKTKRVLILVTLLAIPKQLRVVLHDK